MSLAQTLMSKSIGQSYFCISVVVTVVVDDKEKKEIVDNVVKVDENFLNPGRLTLGVRVVDCPTQLICTWNFICCVP